MDLKASAEEIWSLDIIQHGNIIMKHIFYLTYMGLVSKL